MNEEVVELNSFRLIADVPVSLVAELDHRSISFQELLTLDVDSLVPLTRPLGENIDVYVAGAFLGSGEILVNGTKLGVRIAGPVDRSGSALPSSEEMYRQSAGTGSVSE